MPPRLFRKLLIAEWVALALRVTIGTITESRLPPARREFITAQAVKMPAWEMVLALDPLTGPVVDSRWEMPFGFIHALLTGALALAVFATPVAKFFDDSPSAV